MPSQPLQAKARNDGLFYAVLVLLAIALLALRVEVMGRLENDRLTYDAYMAQRQAGIERIHRIWHFTGGLVEVRPPAVWCGPYIDEKGLHVPKLQRHGVLKGI